MYPPHLLESTNEPLITHRFNAMPFGRIKRVNVWKGPIECDNMLGDGLDELLHLIVVLGCVAKLRIAQFDGMDVIGALLGIDNQHATLRVAFALRGEEGGGQLPLTGAP